MYKLMRFSFRFNISIFEILFGRKTPIPGTIFGEILVILNTIVLSTFGIMYAYQIIFSAISVFIKAKKYPASKKYGTYIFVTSARNEENVIGQLIESIRALNYPQEKIVIHLIADNCTDNTVTIAKSYGIEVFERNDTTKTGKSYALDFYFKEVYARGLGDDVAGFIVVDTDNVFDTNFLQEINNVKVATNADVIAAYRNSTNMGESLWTFGTGYSFLRECSLLHKVREHCKLSSYISGTSFFVSKGKMGSLNGWPFHALIEDIEFSAHHVYEGGVAHYAHDAIFYDEQPVKMSTSMKQRLRWVKGIYQVFNLYAVRMFKKLFARKQTFRERVITFESLLFIIPLPGITAFWLVIYGILGSINFALTQDAQYFVQTYLFTVFDFAVTLYLFALVTSLFITIADWRRVKMSAFKKITLPFVAFFFLVTYIPLLLIAPFMKVKWHPITHHGVKTKL